MVAPIVVFCVVLLMVIVARFYDRLPVNAPPCGFRKITGVPCIACRGTRSFTSLSRGRVFEAFRLNPAAIIGVFGSTYWLLSYLVRKGELPRRQFKPSFYAWVIGAILMVNWLYLIITRHWYP